MGGEFFKDFKSSNGIEISWLVQALSNFNWFRGSTPLGGVGWVDGVGVGMGVWGVSHAHTHTCMHAHTHMHVEHDKHDKHGCLHVGGHLQFYTCVVCACACMHMHVGTPPMPPDAPHHLPLPRAAGGPKHQNSISLELIKIFWFCLKILYLWTLLNSYRL